MRAAALLLLLLAVPAAADAPTGLQPAVTFTDATPLSRNAEIAARMLTPLAARGMQRMLARSGRTLSGQPIAVEKESFLLLVPGKMPPGGYGLLVFIPAWKDARIPKGWQGVLEDEGVIYVSAANSGNDADVLARRVPLALAAAAHVLKTWPVNPAHIFVGGMSGGSRIALRVALGYGDLFHGALLNSGSDPIGDAISPLPPPRVFHAFQEQMRLVWLSGELDPVNVTTDLNSDTVMARMCVANRDRRTMPRLGHETADPASLAWALDRLLAPREPFGAEGTACRAGHEGEMAEALAWVAALADSGKPDAARALLAQTDARFGGLAAPRSLALDDRLANTPEMTGFFAGLAGFGLTVARCARIALPLRRKAGA